MWNNITNSKSINFHIHQLRNNGTNNFSPSAFGSSYFVLLVVVFLILFVIFFFAYSIPFLSFWFLFYLFLYPNFFLVLLCLFLLFFLPESRRMRKEEQLQQHQLTNKNKNHEFQYTIFQLFETDLRNLSAQGKIGAKFWKIPEKGLVWKTKRGHQEKRD